MRSTSSSTTGNIIYHADNDRFSSSNKEAVISFEKLGLEKKQDFFNNRSLAIMFLLAGNCSIANEYIRDASRIYNDLIGFEKSIKKGNWCPLKVQSAIEEKRVDIWCEFGYSEQ
jgi:hypothetical protein